MKLHDLVLLETSTGRTTPLKMDKAIQLAKTTYSNYFKQFEYPVLYRGSSNYASDMNPILVNPTVGTRRGTDSAFGYTEMISNLDSWKGLPRRDKSLIMTNRSRYAKIFGTPVGVVLPNNFTAIGTDKDFWYAYVDKLANIISLESASLSAFDRLIQVLFYNPTDLKDMVNKIPEYIESVKSKEFDFHGNAKGLTDALIAHAGGKEKLSTTSVINFFDILLDPRNNNKINIINSMSDINYKEVWTDATCMLLGDIPYNHIKKTIEAV